MYSSVTPLANGGIEITGRAEEYIRDNKLGHPAGRCVRSGYCIYPEYEFDMQEIAKYTMKQEQAERPAPAKTTDKEAR